MRPKISVIIPIYNVEQYLRKCIDSVLNQHFEKLEIILVDDESPDSCPQICDEYAASFPNIKVIHKKNQGLGMARNSGLSIASGEYVTFLDSDDFLECDAYKRIYMFAVQNQLDICFFRHQRVTENGAVIKLDTPLETTIFQGKTQVNDFLLDLIGRIPNKPSSRISVSVCMALFKLEIIKKYNLHFESERVIASEDLIFHSQFLSHVSKIGVLPDVYYNYLINIGSISTTFNTVKYNSMIKLLFYIKEFLYTNYVWKDVKWNFYSRELQTIRILLRLISKSVNLDVLDRLSYIKKISSEPILSELLTDDLKGFSFIDRAIVGLINYKMYGILYLAYRYVKR